MTIIYKITRIKLSIWTMRCIQEISIRYLIGIRIAWMFARFFFSTTNRSPYTKSPTRFLSECVLQFFHRQCPAAHFDLLWNNAIYGSLFTEVCLLYIRANVPTMGPVVSTSRSQLSVIASRKTRRRNFCKWSHSLSTVALCGMASKALRDFYSPERIH